MNRPVIIRPEYRKSTGSTTNLYLMALGRLSKRLSTSETNSDSKPRLSAEDDDEIFQWMNQQQQRRRNS
eukprot:CAMPEP_0185766066 /NCGR_PEP_ID=MMETSP1174-20130828/35091_1 /TAXON_ID=35687 /ORGANISM="Dictyocha speculum, Strain CCMP1381" /LENGTH=68 /DNA_ID=CAMNT_0028449561 /DNA_START=168 /DNA_END=371 /DNA_ORIENTATION=+